MKRVISLILAIVMVALLAPMAISADEIKTVDATGGEAAASNLSKGDQWTITKKYFAVSYTMNYAAKAGKVDGDTKDNGCNGIILGGADSVGCVFLPYDGVDGNQKTANKVLKFGPWWNTDSFGAKRSDVDASAYVGKDVTILLVGSYENKKLTVKAYLNGTAVKAWGADEFVIENFNGQLGWATKLAGVKATAKFVESDTALDKTAFDAKAPVPSVKTGAIMGEWTKNGTTYISKTGDLGSGNGTYYQLGGSEDFEISAKIKLGGQMGFIVGVNDANNDGKITEAGDQYYLIDFMTNGKVGVEKNNTKWGGWMDEDLPEAGQANAEITAKVTYKKGTVTVYADGKKLLEKSGESFGTGYGLWSKTVDGVFADVTVKVNDGGSAPQTGEATAIVAVIAVLTLAGVAVAAKKRH